MIEYQQAVAHLGARGPDIYADATDAYDRGIDALLADALSAIGLGLSDVDWLNDQLPTATEIASLRKWAEGQRGGDPGVACGPSEP
jgi:hypothetical protein